MSDDPNARPRTALRVVGGVLVVAGLVCAIVGIASFFQAFNSDGSSEPHRFYFLFIGLPLLAVGGWCLMAGFGGAAARYAARELSPAARTLLGSLPGQSRAGQPGTGQPAAPSAFCTSCGAGLAPGARFCGSCGQPA